MHLVCIELFRVCFGHIHAKGKHSMRNSIFRFFPIAVRSVPMGIRSLFYAQMPHTINLVSTQRVNAPPKYAHNSSSWPMSTRKVRSVAVWDNHRMIDNCRRVDDLEFHFNIIEQKLKSSQMINDDVNHTHTHVVFFYTHTPQNLAIWIYHIYTYYFLELCWIHEFLFFLSFGETKHTKL